MDNNQTFSSAQADQNPQPMNNPDNSRFNLGMNFSKHGGVAASHRRQPDFLSRS